MGCLAEASVCRVRLSGLEDSWTILAPKHGEVDRHLRVLTGTRAEQLNKPLELANAQQSSELVGQHYLVIFIEDSGLVGWQSLLPFLVETSEFYVVEPAHADSNRRSLGVPLRHHQIQDIALTENRLFGWTVWVIEN